MSLKPTLDVAPQVGLVNVQTDALLALSIHSSTQDKLKEICEAIATHERRHIRNPAFEAIILKVIDSNICHRTSTTRILFGVLERRTDINNHLVP